MTPNSLTPMFRRAYDLTYGDLVALHGDVYANGADLRLVYRYDYAIVTRVAAGEVAAGEVSAVVVSVLCPSGEYSFVCPFDHTIRLAEITPLDPGRGSSDTVQGAIPRTPPRTRSNTGLPDPDPDPDPDLDPDLDPDPDLDNV